uniref:Cystathionine gamma-lyase n=1 Tax=Oryzias sinensis TaxID=183150 RepID=A0A8C7ZNP4_9TELE
MGNGLFAGFRTAFKSFATDAIHVGQEPEQWKSMAVVPPISLSTTFKQYSPGDHAVSNNLLILIFLLSTRNNLSNCVVCLISVLKVLALMIVLIHCERFNPFQQTSQGLSGARVEPETGSTARCRSSRGELKTRYMVRYRSTDEPTVVFILAAGLPSHPQYDIMKRQCTGCPGMIAFYIKGKLENAKAFLCNLKVVLYNLSLCFICSLLTILGISDTLIRLSVGLEDEADIIEDLDQALNAAHPKTLKMSELKN